MERIRHGRQGEAWIGRARPALVPPARRDRDSPGEAGLIRHVSPMQGVAGYASRAPARRAAKGRSGESLIQWLTTT